MELHWRFSVAIKSLRLSFIALLLGTFLGISSAHAEIKFEKKSIKLGNKTLVVEIAENPAQFERGLMFRESLDKDSGMLFVFPNEQTRFFWMKNTLIDLSIAYFNKNGVLINIVEMKSGRGISDADLPSYPSERPAKFALEMEAGWFTKNKIKPGTKLTIIK